MKLLILAALVAVAFSSNVVEIAKLQYKQQFGKEYDYADTMKFKIPTEEDFEAYMKAFGKTYASEDEKKLRLQVFQVNMWVAQALESTELGTGEYGATKFADLTPKEFKKMYTGEKPAPLFGAKPAVIPNIQAPASVDWRKKNAVTEVKNQQQCGSCWAFSTTGNVEGQWAIKKGKLISLSESQINDCDKADDGCEGGLPSRALKYVEKYGLETEASYPYKPKDEACKYDKSKVVVYTNSSVHISKNEGEMATWCAANGPISIGINAEVMQLYKGGISKPNKQNCNPELLDHGVLIVGYGTQGSTPFWIIKNSWGKDWGEEGYYRVHRGSGACGLNQDCNSAIID